MNNMQGNYVISKIQRSEDIFKFFYYSILHPLVKFAEMSHKNCIRQNNNCRRLEFLPLNGYNGTVDNKIFYTFQKKANFKLKTLFSEK